MNIKGDMMKKSALILVTLATLSGCVTPQSEQYSAEYEESLTTARKILKNSQVVDKYQKYYSYTSHKAFAKSKINSVWSYSAGNTKKEYAIEKALASCNEQLLKNYDQITDSVSCEIVNINNEWVNK